MSSISTLHKTRAKTQFSEDNSHLCVELFRIFPDVPKTQPIIAPPPSDDSQFVTNFNISVYNPYCFILLHLRNKGHKNPMNLYIPEVCIFHDRTPYDIVHNSKGYIRGTRNADDRKLRMKDMQRVFKDASAHDLFPKNEQIVAAFAQKQMLMVSDNDLFLIVHKTRQDPFFKKLRYIRNKIPANNSQPIVVPFNQMSNDNSLIKLATQSLLGSISEQQCYNRLFHQEDGQQKYLSFMNRKIVLYLNYEHNIRVKRCQFVYIKTNDPQHYYFVDVHNLEFHNLTSAILERQKRLAQQQQQRNKILIMSPEKEVRYRSWENKTNVKTYENIMHGHFHTIMNKLNVNKVSDNKLEQVRNQLAFKKLHPKSKFTYTQVISSSNFMKVKDKVLQNQSRKPLTIPSRYVRRFYNKVKSTRVKTQVITIAGQK